MRKHWGANISPPPPLVLIMVVVAALATTEVVSLEDAPPPSNCTRWCGGKHLPYPFGLKREGENCYLESEFSLTCNDSYNPPKLFSGEFEVLDIILPVGRMRVLMEISYDCYNSTTSYAGTRTWRASLGDMFMLSYQENVFTAVGCDTEAKFSIGPDKYGGCMTGCNSLTDTEDGQCLGIGCCQSHVPEKVNLYNTSFLYRHRNSNTYRFNNCSYSFMVERNNYTFRKSDLTYMNQSTVFPMILDWFIGNQSCDEAKKNSRSYACVSSHSHCLNSTNGPGYLCNCSQGYQGNPYLKDGCQDIDECKSKDLTTYPCHGICINTKGSYNCTCPGSLFSKDPRTQPCERTRTQQEIPRKVKIALAIGGTAILFLFLLLLFSLGYQKRQNIRLKKRFFEKNGGVHLQQVLSANQINSFKIFKEAQLETATKNFDDDLVIGLGGSGKVYKGISEDKTVLAVKRFMASDEKDGREFGNEILILSKISHANIVNLLGCCLESKIPMLVYEYIPGGTLYNFLHNKRQQRSISFSIRLQLGVQIARALKYLHVDASPPICHGDVKSSNILLDGDVAKISDFGTSILAPKDNLQFKTMVQGTYGYLDPEYLLTGHLIDKSDVFSYGVILAELLTRKVPVSIEEKGKARNLSNEFVSCANKNNLEEILDPEILNDGFSEELRRMTAITMRCLSMEGKLRPTMKEVVTELEDLGVQENHPWEKYYPPEEDRLLGEATTSTHETSIETRPIFPIGGAR